MKLSRDETAAGISGYVYRLVYRLPLNTPAELLLISLFDFTGDRNMKTAILAAGALALGAASPAHAAQYIFDLSIDGLTGHGTFETDGDPHRGFAIITSVNGLFDGNAMTLLAPGAAPYHPSNDNKFSENGSPFTLGGVAFSAGSQLYNVYNRGNRLYTCIPGRTCMAATSFTATPTSFTATADVAPVPEPATWAILIVGFAALGARLRYRNAQRVRLAYA